MFSVSGKQQEKPILNDFGQKLTIEWLSSLTTSASSAPLPGDLAWLPISPNAGD
jgi:hypothetical protein